jgi:two-component system cell cycle response regulator
LQARVRSLLRGRDARQELRMREDTRTALGFAEACNGFKTPTRVVAAVTTNTVAPDLSCLSQTLDNV